MNRKANAAAEDQWPWINPVGGFGDMLMVSGVLKIFSEQHPHRQFNLIRRTRYPSIFTGHPAISAIGFPPPDAKIIGVDYWSKEPLGPGEHRPFQILARLFGLATPVAERLYLPEASPEDTLHNFIPWKKLNILIAPWSDSPRKTLPAKIWRHLVESLQSEEVLILQAGRLGDEHIVNSYSLLGLTTPRQLVSLLKRCDLVITVDNFIMHAAHLVGKKAVVMWGPTHHQVYGYPEQVHLQMPKMCGLDDGQECIGSKLSQGEKLYATPCPLGEEHCLDRLDWKMISAAVRRLLSPE
jgi:ADP-heptose:LPS heptosyltransferase